MEPLTGEFRIAKGWRIFIYVCSPPLIGLFVYLGVITVITDEFNLTVALILIPVSLGGIALFVYGLMEALKGKFIILSNSVSNKGVLQTRTLEFHEIKGFRTDSNYIHIISNNNEKKSIRTSTYIEKSSQIIEWLAANFLELDSHEAIEEEKQILASDEFGINEQSREYRLSEARRVATYINFIGGCVGVWMWFYPRPYLVSVSIGMTLPLIALGSLFVYRGLIRFDERKNSAYPSIIYGFIAPSGALAIRAIMDYEILSYKDLWITVGVSSILLTVLFLVITKEVKFSKILDYITAFSLAGMIFAYSFGTYVILNCLFDKSTPEVFRTEVIDKEIDSGRSTTYYLKLDPWAPGMQQEKVSVTKDEYVVTDKGDSVDIYLKRGLLKTPWFYVVTE